MDWQALVRTFESGDGDAFTALFAVGGQFRDPVTPWTTDVRSVADHTKAIFPDWHAHVDTLRTGDGWAVMQWTGTGTFHADASRSAGVTMHGMTVVDVDDQGHVTQWRDYLDTAEPMQQIKAALAESG